MRNIWLHLCRVAWLWLIFAQNPVFAYCDIRTADLRIGRDGCAIVSWLHVLPDRGSNRILSGQYGWKDVQEIREQTGKWPAFYEDFLWQMNGSSSWDDWSHADMNANFLKDYWDQGGLVGIHMPIPNPKNKSNQLDRDVTDVEFRDVAVRGTELNRNYLEWMEKLAAHLQWLQEQGVTVFLRPLHEMNGGWFWYGKRDPEDLKKLFRLTVEFLTVDRGLHNLIVVYAPNRGQGVMTYYPGNDVIDVVGVDSYDNQPAAVKAEYDALMHTGKPFAITEIGWSAQGLAGADTRDSKRDILEGIKRYAPRTVWWSSWTATNSPSHQQDCKQLYDDPAVMTRDEVDWRKLKDK